MHFILTSFLNAVNKVENWKSVMLLAISLCFCVWVLNLRVIKKKKNSENASIYIHMIRFLGIVTDLRSILIDISKIPDIVNEEYSQSIVVGCCVLIASFSFSLVSYFVENTARLDRKEESRKYV